MRSWVSSAGFSRAVTLPWRLTGTVGDGTRRLPREVGRGASDELSFWMEGHAL